MTQDIGHSPLGASGAARWMACGGSIELAKEVAEYDDYSVDPAYRVEGSAAHHVAAHCVAHGSDTWEISDRIYEGVHVDKLELECIQTYVDYCRQVAKEDDHVFIEHAIGEKEADRPHPAFYGTVDFAVFNAERLHIVDFKYGAGVVVDVKRNKQCMYYAYGILRDIEREHDQLDPDFPVKITIIQPRTFEDNPIKVWDTTAGEIFEWAREELLPKMRNPGTAFVAGEHCRFCPAKIACPLLKGMFQVAATVNTKWVKSANAVGLGQEWLQIAPVKMYIKALEEEAFNRLNAGVEVPGIKLVQKKAHRVWKSGATEVFQKEFGDLALTVPELKSPAEMAKLGKSADERVKEWAYVPTTGYTVAAASDDKPGIKMKTAQETFANVVQP